VIRNKHLENLYNRIILDNGGNKMKYSDCDFQGWASKNDLKCADGRIIRHGAFAVNDGKKVPLVWNHQHNDPTNVLGHAYLENKDEGVYAYCYFNKSQSGQNAKESVIHGDVTALSIWANNLQQVGSDVLHGVIREVSLVLAGANPGAFIESVMAHSEPMEDGDNEGIFYTNESIEIPLAHSDDKEDNTKKEEDSKVEGDSKENKDDQSKSGSGKTVKDVFNTLTDEQKQAVAIIVGQAVQDAKSEKKDDNKDEGDEKEMKHNLFSDGAVSANEVLSHSDMEKIFSDAKRLGSLKEAVKQSMEDGILAHAIPTEGMTAATGNQTYGFNDPDMLFPDYKSVNNPPEWISRRMDWVQGVISAVHHTPFSRIKSLYANITEDEARAKGYIKGKLKKEEVFTTLKRTTDPQTIYKKQKLDRDDIVDITDFDVVAWIKSEMRVMLDEEIARAILIGDGRPTDSDDKIQESHIRPVVSDVDLFNIKTKVEAATGATEDEIAKATIRAIIKARKNYRGSGNPVFYTTEDVLTNMLLLEDGIGHKLYKTEAELATALRVTRIVTVEPMEGQTVTMGDDKDLPLIGVVVNLADYNVGADKGGDINMFDDFDIDYNQQKYLIETRISGALIKPFSAMTFALKQAAATKTTSANA
jgi:HK97 family phage prohead protease